ncbi:MAG TPA: hypothetical protein VH879_02090 [Gemmatimonadales bacterium]|jgi:hypothetical protein
MIVGVVLLALLAFAVFSLQSWRASALSQVERLYLLMSGVPVILTFLLPAAVSLRGGAAPTRAWLNGASQAGVALSAAMFVAGLYLLWKRQGRAESMDSRLALAVLLASLPMLLLGVVLLLYLPWT